MLAGFTTEEAEADTVADQGLKRVNRICGGLNEGIWPKTEELTNWIDDNQLQALKSKDEPARTGTEKSAGEIRSKKKIPVAISIQEAKKSRKMELERERSAGRFCDGNDQQALNKEKAGSAMMTSAVMSSQPAAKQLTIYESWMSTAELNSNGENDKKPAKEKDTIAIQEAKKSRKMELERERSAGRFCDGNDQQALKQRESWISDDDISSDVITTSSRKLYASSRKLCVSSRHGIQSQERRCSGELQSSRKDPDATIEFSRSTKQ
ncbi:putative inactive serine/threonine-protein kinase lvsG [Dorcoceras hygrometricum]|uniref:Putative inactive serine/threonine-protein kinase lvsG n=1 Tax=Dorcoceras hygrometricum TaxID=472368 RepID=A0A2Z7D8V1_9LAMI|nr:putative inactive serine/threonine-protein kinase lvsG [Dorcoceras hygrometricum]